jgi:hypothetical protein
MIIAIHLFQTTFKGEAMAISSDTLGFPCFVQGEGHQSQTLT